MATMHDRRRTPGPLRRLVVAVAVLAMSVAAGARAEATLAPVPGPASTFTGGADCFVDASYRVFLSRPATQAELGSWTARIAAGTPRAALAKDLANGDEWLRVQVVGLYRQALDRGPDPGGLAYWVAQLRKGTLVNEVGAQIYGSAEFHRRAGGTDRGFVTDLYRRILHRKPDNGGMTHWLGQIARRGRGDVASQFFGSQESRDDRVTGLYASILHRAPDTAGKAHWAEKLRTVNDVALAIQLASSREFYDRAQEGCATAGPTVTHVTTEGWYRDPQISDDGRYLAFAGGHQVGQDWVDDVFTWDRETGITTPVTEGSGYAGEPDMTGDGRHIVYALGADDTGTVTVRVWDRETDRTTTVADDAANPSISDDGRFVVYQTLTLGDDRIAMWDRTTGRSTVLAPRPARDPEISGDGDHVVYAELTATDDRDVWSLHVRDLATGSTIELHDDVYDGDARAISDDGRLVAFVGAAPDDDASAVYLWEGEVPSTTRMSEHGAISHREVSITGNGRFLSYTAHSDWLDESEAVLLDIRTKERILVALDGYFVDDTQASEDGRYIVYTWGDVDHANVALLDRGPQ